MELSETVKNKLSEAIELWMDEHLVDRPAILGNCVYIALEKELLRNQEEIEKQFPLDRGGKNG